MATSKKPASETVYRCRDTDCGAVESGTPQGLAQEGWFLPRGASPNYAYCPDHLPSWVTTWREKRAQKTRAVKKRAVDRELSLQTAAVQKLSTQFHLEVSWPTAWTHGDISEDFFNLASIEAYQCGGGYTGGGIMTGSPLYNSPSNASFIFSSLEGAEKFSTWARNWLEARRHEDCDTRFYKLSLQEITTHAV